MKEVRRASGSACLLSEVQQILAFLHYRISFSSGKPTPQLQSLLLHTQQLCSLSLLKRTQRASMKVSGVPTFHMFGLSFVDGIFF